MRFASFWIRATRRLFAMLAMLILAACATFDQDAPWPATEVGINEMEPVDPLQLRINYRLMDGVPKGAAVMRLHVDEAGHTQRVAVLRSSGNANLDQAFRVTALKAQFRSYLVDGKAVAVTVIAPMQVK